MKRDRGTVLLLYASQGSFGSIKSRDYRCKKVGIVGLFQVQNSSHGVVRNKKVH